MRLLVHDFCGHAFTLELAVHLALREHQVAYVYFASETGPKGDFAHAQRRAPTLEIHGLLPDIPYRKDAFLSRRSFDARLARAFARFAVAWRPEAVISGNCPTEVQSHVVAACRRAGAGFVYWMQDCYSVAASKILKRKIGLPGMMVGAWWQLLDRRHLRASDHIVLIAEHFRPLAERWSGRRTAIEVVENWGVLDQIPQRPRSNPWSRRQHLDPDGRVHFLYSGTLGLKHNPELLVQIAAQLGDRARVTVASHGASVPYLQQRREELGLGGALTLLPLQPFADLPDMLGSADVLVAMIEPDAGTFSVPSKVLSYLCAGQAILLAAPADNLASDTVRRADAGLVVAPDDIDGFVRAARTLLDAETRAPLGANGRRHAEQTFDIGRITTRFEDIFARAIAARKGAR